MFEWVKYLLIVLFGAFLLGNITGCEEPDRTAAALTFLQEAKAEGNLVLTSEPVAAAGMDNRFYFGADKTTLAFDGSIDFADRVRHVSQAARTPVIRENVNVSTNG